MIVDDTKVIIGSANINDRSLNGDRDSEIAVLIEGKKNLQIELKDGTHTRVNNQVHLLRLQLWAEHFNKNVKDLIDPLDDKLREEIFSDAKVLTLLI